MSPSQKSFEHKETVAYGSFWNKYPNSKNCDFKYKYPKQILVREDNKGR